MIELVPLEDRPADWDTRIREYPTKTLFHESVWIDHLLRIRPAGRMQYFRIVDDGAHVGYHCGLLVRKAFVPVHGSPLGGTGTNFMGPLVHEDVDQKELVRAYRSLIGPTEFLHLELSHFWLERAVMEAAGYSVHEDVTRLVPIPETEEEAWSGLKSSGRNRVRKGRDNDLEARRTRDRAIVDHYFAQLEEVFGKQGLGTPYGRDRPAALFDTLMPEDRLLAVQVEHEGEPIATGLFPYDENCIYFWGGASWSEHQSLCPNEMLHWEVITFAVENDIPMYNMCGGNSRFKAKFGGQDVPYLHYSLNTWPGLDLGRRLYRSYHDYRLKREGGRSIIESLTG